APSRRRRARTRARPRSRAPRRCAGPRGRRARARARRGGARARARRGGRRRAPPSRPARARSRDARRRRPCARSRRAAARRPARRRRGAGGPGRSRRPRARRRRSGAGSWPFDGSPRSLARRPAGRGARLARMPAARILSLLPSTTEIAAALGLADRLGGRSPECTVPPEVLRLPVVTEPKLDPAAPSAAIDARVKALVRDGLSVYRVDADLARRLAPDVILTQTQCEVCAATPRDLEAAACEWLAGRDGPPPRLVAVAPNTLGDVLDDLVRVAEGCGVAERGRALRAREQARIDAL